MVAANADGASGGVTGGQAAPVAGFGRVRRRPAIQTTVGSRPAQRTADRCSKPEPPTRERNARGPGTRVRSRRSWLRSAPIEWEA